MARKGSARDIAVVMLLLFSVVFVGFFSLKFYRETNDRLETALVNSGKNYTATMQILEHGDDAQVTAMSSIPFAVFGAGIAAIVLAFFIPVHPIFLPFSVIMWLIFIALQAMLANVMWEFINHPEIIGLANEFPLVVAIVQKSPLVIAVVGFLIIGTMTAKAVSDGVFN